MIRIAKGPAPQHLTVAGAAEARRHCADYEADAAGYDTGRSKHAIAEGIYAHRTVRQALEQAQHGKCCYCEAQPEKPYAFLHVEHWRPKSYSQQARRGKALRPGYYWLAYDWDNLLLSCHFCNSSNKGNVFPLFNPAARARNHNGDVAAERPMLLKPDGPEDPRDHIGFHEEIPFGKTPAGVETVQILGLDKAEHAGRQRLLQNLKDAHGYVTRYRDRTSPEALEVVAMARAFLAHAVRPDAPFSAMASAFVDRNPVPL
ncbi:hypothetical protein [Methylobacterium durans]|uniref:TIGR02646 family protein n=1 Tax=Methylobacterium durans TaxID=2202825 RepID=A0A2U8W8S8_9HYPH|nr:hypothetical protein [Methylobacterium durans]AWN42517.1 hypothetical protein DK389_20950 [Methylobacterium durans]